MQCIYIDKGLPPMPPTPEWLLKDSSASDPKRPKHQQDQGPKNASFCTRRGARSVDSGRSLLKFSSASDPKRPKHQQDSSPCQAKNTPKECLTWPLEPIKNKANTSRIKARRTRVFAPEGVPGAWIPDDRCSNSRPASDPKRPKHQQDSSPCQAKNTPKECLTWPLEPIKNNALAGSRPEEREFLHKKGCQERGFRTIAAQILVSLRSEKTETPARFEPMPSKKHAERMPHVTFGTHKKQCFGPVPKHRDFLHQTGYRTSTFKTHLNTSRAWSANDGCSKIRQPQIRKDRNTSRIKARRTRVFAPEGVPGAWIPDDGYPNLRQPQIRKDRNTSKDSSPCQAKNT